MSSNVPYTEFLEPYSEYPAAIRSHVAIADSRPEVRDAVTGLTRKVFLEIIRRANVPDPEQPVWIRVDSTAKRIGVCTRTVSRTIKMMVENGWLVRSNTHDGRNSLGEFNGCEYLLTTAMRRLMSLPVEGTSSPKADGPDVNSDVACSLAARLPQSHGSEKRVENLPIRPVARPAPQTPASLPPGSGLSKALAIAQRLADEERSKKQIIEPNSPQCSITDPAEKPTDNSVLPFEVEDENSGERTGLSCGAIYEVNKVFKKEASLHKSCLFLNDETGKPIRLPMDLLPLVEQLGIRPAGVCKLMRIAKATGHRLQDVWKVKGPQLLSSGAKEGRASTYIEFLLNCGEDFAYRARTKIAEVITGTSTPKRAPTAPKSPSPAADCIGPSSHHGAPKEPDHSLASQFKMIAQACRFKRFRHISKSIQVRFYGDDEAEVTNGFARTIYDKKMLENVYKGIMAGNLVEVVE